VMVRIIPSIEQGDLGPARLSDWAAHPIERSHQLSCDRQTASDRQRPFSGAAR